MKTNYSVPVKRPHYLGLAQKALWPCALTLALAMSLPAMADTNVTPAPMSATTSARSLEAVPAAVVTTAAPATSISAAAPPSAAVLEQSVQATMVPAGSAEGISGEIYNFDVVSKGLWRGSLPSHKAIGDLAKNGVKTIIDLRYAGSGCLEEAQVAQQYGIKYVNIPLGFKNPSLGDIATFLAIVSKPANQPVYVHCRQGADRTGTVCGVFRILHDHWSFKQAYNEMRQHHFKPFLGKMKSLVARCEVDPNLSKELTDMASRLDDGLTGTKVSVKTSATNI
jgi:protein tyrosine phosphatase (PTP) superfamily phosphohydrolase (DUF442 family)